MSGGLAGSVKRKLSEEMLNHGLLNSPVYPCFQGLGCMYQWVTLAELSSVLPLMGLYKLSCLPVRVCIRTRRQCLARLRTDCPAASQTSPSQALLRVKNDMAGKAGGGNLNLSPQP